jgi:hypothetical protein
VSQHPKNPHAITGTNRLAQFQEKNMAMAVIARHPNFVNPITENANAKELAVNINASQKNLGENSNIYKRFCNYIAKNYKNNFYYDGDCEKEAKNFLFSYAKKIALAIDPGSNFSAHCTKAFEDAGGSELNASTLERLKYYVGDFKRNYMHDAGAKAICAPLLQADKSASGTAAHENPGSEDDEFIFAGQKNGHVKKDRSNDDSLYPYNHYNPCIIIDVGPHSNVQGGLKLKEVTNATDVGLGPNRLVRDAVSQIANNVPKPSNIINTAVDAVTGGSNPIVQGVADAVPSFSIGGFFSSIASGLAHAVSALAPVGRALAPVGRVLGAILVGGYENVLTPIGHVLGAVGGGILYILEEALKGD